MMQIQQKANLDDHSSAVQAFVTLLMEIHQYLVVHITLPVYGMLRQDNKKPNWMVILEQFIQFVTLLMEIHQLLVVLITLSVSEMQKEILQSYKGYKELFTQFKIPFQNSSLLQNESLVRSIRNTYLIRTIHELLRDRFKTIVQSKESCFLEVLKQKLI
ncbi:unnamed protein product [Paramecium octaurelia]|uniref:Uncharacterized protein n=1 Tax=Paramecium octaurelia TaxID=43137 RepID=A0A8S1Y561_PAROT|nr:unnamed protein product [Paramecium octaurelia]